MRAALQRLGWPLLDQVWPGLPPPVVPPAPIALRRYQAAAVAAWAAADRRGVLVLPTGAGKTRAALACLQSAGGRALVLVPTRVLLEQWCAALVQLGFRPQDVGRYGDGAKGRPSIWSRDAAPCEAALGQVLAALHDRLPLLSAGYALPPSA